MIMMCILEAEATAKLTLGSCWQNIQHSNIQCDLRWQSTRNSRCRLLKLAIVLGMNILIEVN